MRNVPELNGLRGIAILAVFFHHACYANLGSVVAPGWNPAIRALGTISKYGDAGVDIFFVLSGFLISSILLRDRASSKFYPDFYWKRLLRIGPVLLLGLIVTVLLHEYRYALVSLFILGNFGYHIHAVGTAPFWSLAIERAVLFRLADGDSQDRTARASLAGNHNRDKRHSAALPLRLRPATAITTSLFFAWIRWRSDRFSLSCFMNAHPVHRSHGSWPRCSPLASCASASSGSWVRMSMPTRQLGVTLFSASIVYFSVCYSGSSSLAFLRSKVLLFFAEISYAMYLFHLFVVRVYDRHFGLPAVGNNDAYWIRLSVLLLGSIGVALLSRYAIELPALSLRTRVLSHPRVIDPTSEPPLPLAQM